MKRVAQKKKKWFQGRPTGWQAVGICAAILILVGFVAVRSVDAWRTYQKEQADHQQPLTATNVPYCHGEKLDIVVPVTHNPKPLVVYVHGGGWRYGSKVGGGAPYFYQLVDHGIAVASVNYRLSDRAQFPAQFEDVQCAVRFLKSQAQVFGIDPEKIILAGQSAGGNLAMLAAVAANNPEAFDTGTPRQYDQWDAHVAGVIATDAHYDLTAVSFSEKSEANISRYVDDDARVKASPQTYLDEDDPAILMFHGLQDTIVAPDQAENFALHATELGLDVQYIPVKNAGHNLWAWFGRDSPNGDERFQMIKNFIQNMQ